MNDTDMPRHMQFVSLEDIYKELHKNFKFEKSDYNTGGPSNYYVSKKLDIKVGFITPLSNNFVIAAIESGYLALENYICV